MDTIEAIHARRSVRAYLPTELDRALVEDLIWDAAQAPAPTIASPLAWAFVAVMGVARLAALGEAARQFAREHRPPGRGAWVDDPAFKIFWDAPALILICRRTDNPEAASECARAGQNLMLSAHARGLGSCWVGSPMGWLASGEGRAALAIPDGFEAFAPIIVGHPATIPPPRERERPAVVWA